MICAASPISEPPDPAAERTARHLALLQELAEIGMTLARGLQREAEHADTRRSDLGQVFSHIARAVRQTLALEAHLAEGGQVRAAQQAETHQAQQDRKRADADQRRDLVNGVLFDALDHYLAANDMDLEAGEALFDRLDDREDDFANDPRPVGEIVAEVCAALGVTVDWETLEDLHIEVEAPRRRAAPPDRPPPPTRPRRADPPFPRHPGRSEAPRSD